MVAFEGDLGVLYERACTCAKREAELVSMCFVYRLRHADRPRAKVSKELLTVLEASRCASRHKVCACSLGMFRCYLQKARDEYFTDWVHEVAAVVDDNNKTHSFQETAALVFTRLQERHERGATAIGNGKNLSLHKLYSVFVKWTPRGQEKTAKATLLSSEGEKQQSEEEEEEVVHDNQGENETAAEEESPEEEEEEASPTAPRGGRKRQLVSSVSANNNDEQAPRASTKRLRSSSRSEVVGTRSQPQQTTPSRKPNGGTRIGAIRTVAKRSQQQQQQQQQPPMGSPSMQDTQPAPGGHRPTTTVGADSGLQRRIEEKEPHDNASAEELEDEEQAEEVPSIPRKQKLRAPFHPPKNKLKNPCITTDGGKTWREIKWNHRHNLPKGQAWVQPIRPFFATSSSTTTNSRKGELEQLQDEDRTKVAWKQDFEKCYGVNWPLRHVGAFMATAEVEASVSHRATGKEGRHLVLRKCGDITEFPGRQALVERLNKEWQKDLGKHAFNAVQSNLYSGVGKQSDDTVSSLDHIGFHKNGRCKVRGPPIVSGCYSNNDAIDDDEKTMAAFLIHHHSNADIRVWIPQRSGTGYAFGGKHCHKKYYHGKFLFGDWRTYHHHVSITFSCYHPWEAGTQTAGRREGGTAHEGMNVSVDWNLTAEARPWSRRYLLGQVPKSACHSEVRNANEDCIITSNYESVWGPWDEFTNASVLPLLQLHPTDGGQGIAGNGCHALSVLLMNNPKYPNRVTVDHQSATLRVEYYAGSDRGEGLLERARKDRILVRVFLSPGVPVRKALFAGHPTTILFLPLMTAETKGKDAFGVFFVLLAHLSEQELGVRIKQG